MLANVLTWSKENTKKIYSKYKRRFSANLETLSLSTVSKFLIALEQLKSFSKHVTFKLGANVYKRQIFDVKHSNVNFVFLSSVGFDRVPLRMKKNGPYKVYFPALKKYIYLDSRSKTVTRHGRVFCYGFLKSLRYYMIIVTCDTSVDLLSYERHMPK